MKGKFLKHKQNYYRRINHLMNRINLKLSLENENESLKNEIKIEEKKTQKKCSICNKNEVKYICPKCKIPYCSMDCYKKHNKECTEEFYKNNVIEELKSMKFKEEETKIFKEKLKNYQEKLNKIDEKYEEIKDEENNKIKNKEIERYEEILNKMNNDKFNAKYDFTSEDWTNFHNFMKRAYLIMSDSGGVQEEAPSLGKPVLVLRDTTERPEGVEAGTLKLVGTEEDDVYNAVKKVSEERGLQVIFDRASSQSIVFASPNIDISNQVLERLGYSK